MASVNELDQLDWAAADIPNVKYLQGWGYGVFSCSARKNPSRMPLYPTKVVRKTSAALQRLPFFRLGTR